MKWARSNGEKIELDTMSAPHLANALLKYVTYLYWRTVLEHAEGSTTPFYSIAEPDVMRSNRLYMARAKQITLCSPLYASECKDRVTKIVKQGLPLDEKNRSILAKVAKERRLKAIRSEARKLRKELKG